MGTLELAKFQKQRLADGVYNSVRQAILLRGLKPGERLHIEDLARKLEVSLTPVRYAIQQLATEGLVEIKPRGGTFVSSISPQDIEESFEIRCALECLAAEKAIQTVTAADLKRLRQLLGSMRRPLRTQESRDAHDRDNTELHLTLVRAAGNRRLAELYEALNTHIKIARIHASEADWSSRLQAEQLEHEEIVEALEKRDRERLIAVLRRHIHRSKDVLIASLKPDQ